MTILGSTIVGGLPGTISGSGWTLLDPTAAALASGQVAAPVQNTVVGAGYSINFGGATVPPGIIGPSAPAAGAGVPAASWDPYASSGVNGTWAPTPIGKDPVLYAYYASMGNTAANQIVPVDAAGKPIVQASVTGAGAAAAPAPSDAAKKAADAKKADEAKKAAAAAKPASAAGSYTVKSGDTLSGIAQKVGASSWQALYDANKGVVGGNPNAIKPGQVLRIP